jgi:hypothetical protein
MRFRRYFHHFDAAVLQVQRVDDFRPRAALPLPFQNLTFMLFIDKLVGREQLYNNAAAVAGAVGSTSAVVAVAVALQLLLALEEISERELARRSGGGGGGIIGGGRALLLYPAFRLVYFYTGLSPYRTGRGGGKYRQPAHWIYTELFFY